MADVESDSMNDAVVESTRRWSVTYVAVIASELLWLLALWWLGHHFGN
jgi:hypothetical protein